MSSCCGFRVATLCLQAVPDLLLVLWLVAFFTAVAALGAFHLVARRRDHSGLAFPVFVAVYGVGWTVFVVVAVLHFRALS